ncbi:branched-chain amino acid ABC transporter substrate-binding protein [Acidovorax sp. SDU_ACID1]|uniref:branched-chain amino acid ABC transporter substrate-binding protein n=1 Tax=Acidovorax sp. SDU_ACID1 TaxID=3136632 RepID=UPI0038735598
MNRKYLRVAGAIANCTVAALLTLNAGAATAKDLVKIAFIGPLTGGVSSTGLGGRNSAQLAVDQHNADPSKKYRVELVKLDDECKPAVGVQVVTRAATDRNIIGAVGHYCSAVAIVTVDTFHRFGLPLVIWGAVLPEITYGNSFKEIHRVNGTMINEGKLAAEYVQKAGFKRVALIYDTTDYGKGQSVHFMNALKQFPDITVTGSYGVDVTQQDFSAELTAAQRGKPDVIWFGGLTPQGVSIKAQLQRIGIATPFIGVSGILNEGFIAGLGSAVAEGVVSFHNGAPIEKYAKGKEFLTAYAAAGFKEEPDAYGPFAYSATKLLIDAIEKVGPNRAKVRDELNTTRDYESLVGTINFDDHRQNITNAHQYVVQDGKWVYWADSKYAKEQK